MPGRRVRETARQWTERVIHVAAGRARFRRWVQRAFLASIEETPLGEFSDVQMNALQRAEDRLARQGLVDARGWWIFEPLYYRAKQSLDRSRLWRYAPAFIRENAKPVIDALAGFGASIEGKTYCDLGCGAEHPYGTSVVMFLNGASSAIATDLVDVGDSTRASLALAELLIECWTCPDDWHWSQIPREEFTRRLASFDVSALRRGDLKSGLGASPLSHVVASVYDPPTELHGFDVMSSRSVLEHFLDFDTACARLFQMMAPGGLAYHYIDMADHRMYGSPDHHPWSFLAEDDQWSDSMCNRLRFHELSDAFQRTGFEVLRTTTKDEPIPAAVRQSLRGRFAIMSDEQLSTIRAAFLLRRAPRVDSIE